VSRVGGLCGIVIQPGGERWPAVICVNATQGAMIWALCRRVDMRGEGPVDGGEGPG